MPFWKDQTLYKVYREPVVSLCGISVTNLTLEGYVRRNSLWDLLKQMIKLLYIYTNLVFANHMRNISNSSTVFSVFFMIMTETILTVGAKMTFITITIVIRMFWNCFLKISSI